MRRAGTYIILSLVVIGLIIFISVLSKPDSVNCPFSEIPANIETVSTIRKGFEHNLKAITEIGIKLDDIEPLAANGEITSISKIDDFVRHNVNSSTNYSEADILEHNKKVNILCNRYLLIEKLPEDKKTEEFQKMIPLIDSIFLIFSGSVSKNPEEKTPFDFSKRNITAKIHEYFDMITSKEYHRLNEFVVDPMDRYHGEPMMSIFQIKNVLIDYDRKFINRAIELIPETVEPKRIGDNVVEVKFETRYQMEDITSGKICKFNLLTTLHMNNSGMFKSISESTLDRNCDGGRSGAAQTLRDKKN